MTTHNTTIEGSDGIEHVYQTEVFKLRELVQLELELGKIAGGAAGPGIDYLYGLFSIDKKGLHLAADPDKSTDSTKLGKAITALPAGLLEAGGYDFIARILARTSREVDLAGDGKDLVLKGLTAAHPGGDGSTWMDNIYPGNLGEMHLAVFWVLTVNFSPFGRGPSWSLSKLWEELQSGIPMLSEMMTATEEQKSAGSSDTPTPTE